MRQSISELNERYVPQLRELSRQDAIDAYSSACEKVLEGLELVFPEPYTIEQHEMVIAMKLLMCSAMDDFAKGYYGRMIRASNEARNMALEVIQNKNK